MLCFLSDFGSSYAQTIKEFQETQRPWAHLAYYQILELQQSIFNVALKFRDTAEHADQVIAEPTLEDSNDREANSDGIRKGSRKRAPSAKVDPRWCTCNQPHGNKDMIMCSNYCACLSTTPTDEDGHQWFHFDCVNLTVKEAEKMKTDGVAWFCSRCVEKRGPKAQGAKGALEWVTASNAMTALKLCGVSNWKEGLTSADDPVGQFWDPKFRAAICNNDLVEPRSVVDVSWCGYPLTQKYFQNFKGSAEEKKAQSTHLIEICYSFFKYLNRRLDENGDMAKLEACTVLDPRPAWKSANKPQCERYVGILLTAFGSANFDKIAIQNGASKWFLSPSNNFGADEAADVLVHFRQLHQSGIEDMVQFAGW